MVLQDFTKGRVSSRDEGLIAMTAAWGTAAMEAFWRSDGPQPAGEIHQFGDRRTAFAITREASSAKLTVVLGDVVQRRWRAL